MATCPGLWHRHAEVAYLAVFLGMIGHATSEFVAVVSGVAAGSIRVALSDRRLRPGRGRVAGVPRALLAPLREAFWPILGLSLIGVCLGYLLFHWSLDFATVPQVATTVTAAPIYVAVVNRWLNREPITTAKWVTGIAALIGVALLVTDGAIAELAGSGRNLFGMFLVICSSFLIGGFTVVAKPYIARYGALRITTLSMAISGVALWLLVGVIWGIWVNPLALFERPSGEWAALLTIGLYNTTLTQWLWLAASPRCPTSPAACTCSSSSR
jgi:drug/metabolite transporter, DME family